MLKATEKEVETEVKNEEPVMSVHTFLRRYPQNETVTVLLKAKYPMAVKTVTEWNEAIHTLLTTRLQSYSRGAKWV